MGIAEFRDDGRELSAGSSSSPTIPTLARQVLVRRGAKVGPRMIRWTYTHTGEETASGLGVRARCAAPS
jgi:hypothetical protein